MSQKEPLAPSFLYADVEPDYDDDDAGRRVRRVPAASLSAPAAQSTRVKAPARVAAVKVAPLKARKAIKKRKVGTATPAHVARPG